MLRKIFLVSFFLLSFSCSKENSNLNFGSQLPAFGISKDLPVVIAPQVNGVASSELIRKHLDTILDTEMVLAPDLELFQNKDSYPKLISMVKNSKKFFYMNVLSFTCDSTTETLVKILEDKARAAVDVRLIVNKFFSIVSLSCLSRLKSAGVKVLKAKTHSSYFLNDDKELLIGSQSVARMFFLADGYNSLDRDMMLYSTGALATDAFKDFISIWAEESGAVQAEDLASYNELLKNDYEQGLRGKAYPSACRFVSERPAQGIKDIQNLWMELVKVNTEELYFSGVKVETGTGALGQIIKEKSLQGIKTQYLGNGYSSGNGELTMVLEEWIQDSALLAPLLKRLRDWDKGRLLKSNLELYDSLKEKADINVWGYFNFIHYKVWLFDHPGVFIGSANLDESKFGGPYEAGVYCQDSKLHTQLKAQLLRDMKNSTLYKEVK